MLRPPGSLSFFDPMVILALAAGIAAGAVGVLLAVRPALAERRHRVDEVIELRSELAKTCAELSAERSVLDFSSATASPATVATATATATIPTASERVAATLAAITDEVVTRHGAGSLLLMGGEGARAVLDRFGARAIRVTRAR